MCANNYKYFNTKSENKLAQFLPHCIDQIYNKCDAISELNKQKMSKK